MQDLTPSAVKQLEPDKFIGEESMWLALEQLHELIIKKLNAAGRRVKK